MKNKPLLFIALTVLLGVVDVVSDWRVKVAVKKGYLVFASTPEASEGMFTVQLQDRKG